MHCRLLIHHTGGAAGGTCPFSLEWETRSRGVAIAPNPLHAAHYERSNDGTCINKVVAASLAAIDAKNDALNTFDPYSCPSIHSCILYEPLTSGRLSPLLVLRIPQDDLPQRSSRDTTLSALLRTACGVGFSTRQDGRPDVDVWKAR